MAKRIILFVLAFQMLAGFAFAEDSGGSQSLPVVSDQVVEVLLVFLVLALVFEVALTPIFNWRVFVKHFEGKGYKTPITVILALLVFWKYDLDIIKDLLIGCGGPT